MARKPDVPCTQCGTLLWSGSTSLPAGERRCRMCRASTPRAARVAECVRCGAAFSVRHGTTGRFCSVACANIFNTGGRSRNRTCDMCGAAYVACDYRQRFCSRTCAKLDYPNRRWPSCRLYWHSCSRCSRTFATGRATARFCSDECAERRCRCGAPIQPRRRSCAGCVEAARKAGNRAYRARRRARRRAAVSEPFTVEAVFERDGWRCHLCGKQVLRDARVPHPKAPTIDHLVPLADGGDHTRANVATAHFLCNSLRGAGGAAQLALIG